MTDDLTAFRNERRISVPKKIDLSSQETRTEAQRDRDRILYSYEFRRLAHVTQVVSESETQLFHNRLTHSLKVAQIARRLSERLLHRTDASRIENAGGLDPDVTESAALAHDIGHPPFGHMAEKEFQALLMRPNREADESGHAGLNLDSFEGNAQSFRIVCRLAFRSTREGEPALNLTRATLNAILKYPWLFGEHPSDRYKEKWGAYWSERSDFDFARERARNGAQGLEARIMDFSDDVSYAVHDVEDFFRAGLVPLDRLRNQEGERAAFIDYASEHLGDDGFNRKECEEAFEQVSDYAFLAEPYDGSRQHRESLHKVASDLLSIFLSPVEVNEQGILVIPRLVETQVAVLKQLTWRYVIDNSALAMTQEGQRRVINTLFTFLIEVAAEAANKPSLEVRMPRLLREQLGAIRTDDEAIRAYQEDDALLRVRAVVDYIASLTERQAIDLYQRVSGTTPNKSALEPWLSI